MILGLTFFISNAFSFHNYLANRPKIDWLLISIKYIASCRWMVISINFDSTYRIIFIKLFESWEIPSTKIWEIWKIISFIIMTVPYLIFIKFRASFLILKYLFPWLNIRKYSDMFILRPYNFGDLSNKLAITNSITRPHTSRI